MTGFPSIGRQSKEDHVVHTVNRINRGKINATVDVTLTASTTSTGVVDDRIATSSAIIFDPMTASAAAELAAGTCYIAEVDRNNGGCTITHANAISIDRTFRLLIIG